MEIRARSIYNQETCSAAAQIIFKNRLLPLIIILTCIFTLLFLIQRLIISAIVFLIMMIFLTLFTFKFSVSNQYKTFYKLQNTHYYFLFRDNDFTLSAQAPNGVYTGQSIYNYNIIYQVIEHKNYLLIYITKAQALIVDKRTIENGTMDNIRCKLMPLLGKKYKITR